MAVLALTRAVPASIQHCELTHLQRAPIDYPRAVAQHAAYERCLERLGCRVERLPAAPDLPDSVFVEDAAVVFDHVAVIARPGAPSRRPEVDAVAASLVAHRPLAFIEPPGTLDGGDVLVIPPSDRAAGRVFVGMSGRTNEEGARQLAAMVAPYGFDLVRVPVTGCLHLKSAVTLAGVTPSGGRSILLINREWVDAAIFRDHDLIEVDPSEPAAANVLRIGADLVCAEEYPKTRARMEARGLVTHAVAAGELAKAEGAVTCCSLVCSLRSPR